MEKYDPKKQEEFVRLVPEQQLGIKMNRKQRKFLRLVKKQGVCVNITEESRSNKEFQKLVGLLSDMHKSGVIPSFQIVEV